MEWVIAHWEQLTTLVFALVGIASVVVKMTGTEKDDKILDAIIAILNAIAFNPTRQTARRKTSTRKREGRMGR